MARSKSKPEGVKIPTVRQLPSGSWFCQLRIGGKSISITDEDYDTVVAKAYAYKTGLLKAKKSPKDITVGQALINHIESLRAVRSPSTIRGYYVIARNRLKSLQERPLSALTEKMVQREINAESAICSPKTLRNAWTLFAAAIEEAGGERYNVRLPQVPPAKEKYLEPEQIPIMLEAIKGSPFEIPILLGLWSCRRSEILGLTWDNIDLKKRQIRIDSAIVQGDDGKFITKYMPKNRSSVRTIPISDQLYEALAAVENKTGKVYDRHPDVLYKGIQRICKKHELPMIGIHGLRHSFASLAYSLGLPPKITMRIGGWQTDDVMMKIYTHISERDINKSAAAVLDYFNNNNTGLLNIAPSLNNPL